MEPAKLVLLCIAAVCAAAACLGEITALVCPEVFLLDRPKSFGHLPAAALGPLWLVLDFLHPAVITGIAVTLAANYGSRPAVKAFFFRKPLLAHIVFMLVLGLVGGVVGWFAVKSGVYPILGPLAEAVEPARHPLLGAAWWAKLAAHAANLVGGITLATWTWRKRAVFERIVRGE